MSRDSTARQNDIAFLHTSPVHVPTFERLVQQARPGLRVHHVVKERLLAEAQTYGADEPRIAERIHQAMREAAQSGASVVVCTCSTIGGPAEQTPTNGAFVAARIDRAMADTTVMFGPRVLVVAALESTLLPTTTLILDSAKCLARDVQVNPSRVPEAWGYFLQGNLRAYIQAISQHVIAVADGFDVVVLAQASMAPAIESLTAIGCNVLASPQTGVQRAIAVFDLVRVSTRARAAPAGIDPLTDLKTLRY